MLPYTLFQHLLHVFVILLETKYLNIGYLHLYSETSNNWHQNNFSATKHIMLCWLKGTIEELIDVRNPKGSWTRQIQEWMVLTLEQMQVTSFCPRLRRHELNHSFQIMAYRKLTIFVIWLKGENSVTHDIGPIISDFP